MCEVPVFYATSEGQTRRIAERIASDVRTHGLTSTAIDVTTAAADRFEWQDVRGVLLGASLHAGHHQAAAREFAHTFREHFNAVPSAFFSVSLSAASPHPQETAAADHLAHTFPEEGGWQPTRVACFAGRLAYTQYDVLTRLLMRHIARKEGGPTDTRHDHELTDWAAVTIFAHDMVQAIRNAESGMASRPGTAPVEAEARAPANSATT